MNVSLAAQTLSSSVVTAIDFLREEVDLDNFSENAATSDFIRRIDTLFERFQSTSNFAKYE